MSRRSLLVGLGGLAGSQLLGACASSSTDSLRIQVLRGSLPNQLLGEFRKSLKNSFATVSLNVESASQLQDLFSALQEWSRGNEKPSSTEFALPGWVPLVGKREPSPIPDLVTLGDYWLDRAIAQGLLQPVDVKSLKNWGQLSQPLKDLVTRNRQGIPDPTGQVWGAPYLLGSTVIAYRQDIFEERGLQPPTDWSDLWRPELQGRISLLDQPREVIGLTLKKLGKSYNTEDLAGIPGLTQELRRLQAQVKFYSSDAYLQPLLLRDTWVAVGWSTDVMPLVQQGRAIAAIVPKSGTALWANLWVRPALSKAVMLPAVAEWIDLCWGQEIAGQFSFSSGATAPVLLKILPTNLPKDLQQNPVLLPSAAVLQASEFLKPLSSGAIAQYQSLWNDLRHSAIPKT